MARPKGLGGRKYGWTVPPTAPLADAPEWLIAMARRPVAPASATGAASSTSEEKEKRARLYVPTLAPALSGQGGHSVTFRTCMRVARGFALSESQALAVLSAWNQTCKPPWSERELKHKIKQALEVGDYPWGKLLNQTKGRAP